ncbi:MAG: lysophospholipid acyltransferase family protein [Fimbriimonadaceae bacterium]
MSRPGGRAWLPVLRPIVWTALTLFFGAPVVSRSQSRVGRRGPLLVLANHISNSDPVALQLASRRHLRFMARKELFEMGWMGRFMTWWGAFPVAQSSADVGALKTAMRLLAEGEAVCVFPEGQLSPTGDLIELLPGSAMLALRSGSPVVCVALQGSNSLIPYPHEKPRYAAKVITATWGEPRTFERGAPPEDVLRWASEELQRLRG